MYALFISAHLRKMKWLSKSQINCWKQCPKKWYYRYVEKRPSKPHTAMQRGTMVHSHIEEFYKNVEVKDGKLLRCKKDVPELDKFVKFEQKRIQSCVDEDGKFDLKYFNPVAQEVKVSDQELKLRGIIDAVYRHPKDDGLIIIDWKTGKYRPYALGEYRFELAMYKELYERDRGEKVKYWGIYFVDADKLFFEEVKSISIKAMFKAVTKARQGMASNNFPCKPGILCKWCDYSDDCGEWK